MALWGNTDADEAKPKWMTSAEKADVLTVVSRDRPPNACTACLMRSGVNRLTAVTVPASASA